MTIACRVTAIQRKTGVEAGGNGMDNYYTYHVLTLEGQDFRGTLDVRDPLPPGVGYDTRQTVTVEPTP